MRILVYLCFILSSLFGCATKYEPPDYSDAPDFKILEFSFEPSKKFIVLNEEITTENYYLTIAAKIIGSYSFELLDNLVTKSYFKLSLKDQRKVEEIISDRENLEYNLVRAFTLAATGLEATDNPDFNSLKKLMEDLYISMSSDELQNRYFLGLSESDRSVFIQRYTNAQNWISTKNEEALVKYERKLKFNQILINALVNSIGNIDNTNNINSGYGNKVYSPDECIGPIVNGICRGSILPKSSYHKTCYGEMINGQCTGPLF